MVGNDVGQRRLEQLKECCSPSPARLIRRVIAEASSQLEAVHSDSYRAELAEADECRRAEIQSPPIKVEQSVEENDACETPKLGHHYEHSTVP